MKIVLLGFGKTGKLCEQTAQTRGHTIVGTITSTTPPSTLDQVILPADVLIDFSHPEAVKDHIELAVKNKKNIVIGTTGWYDHLPTLKTMIETAGIGCLYAPNFSIGVALFNTLLAKAASLYTKELGYAVSAYEIHHEKKVDAPSGTAKTLAATIEHACGQSVPISSVRVGTIPGIHTFLFNSPHDTITLTHTAHNRQSYAEGAVVAAEWLSTRRGLFTFEDFFAKELL